MLSDHVKWTILATSSFWYILLIILFNLERNYPKQKRGILLIPISASIIVMIILIGSLDFLRKKVRARS